MGFQERTDQKNKMSMNMIYFLINLITYKTGSIFEINYAAFPYHWQSTFQKPVTTMMEGIIDLHHDIMAFPIIIASFVSVLLGVILVRYSRFRTMKTTDFIKHYIERNVTHNTALEIIWTIIPTIILLLIAMPPFASIYALDEIIDPTLTIRVIGRQRYWTYEFPESKIDITKLGGISKIPGSTLNSYIIPTEDLPIGSFRLLEVNRRICLPIHTNIRLLITSYDVIHSWAVPSFGVKVDAMGGRLNEYFLNLNYTGIFYGQCSEICGINHGFMPIKIEAVTSEQFWIWFSVTSLSENMQQFDKFMERSPKILFFDPFFHESILKQKIFSNEIYSYSRDLRGSREYELSHQRKLVSHQAINHFRIKMQLDQLHPNLNSHYFSDLGIGKKSSRDSVLPSVTKFNLPLRTTGGIFVSGNPIHVFIDLNQFLDSVFKRGNTHKIDLAVPDKIYVDLSNGLSRDRFGNVRIGPETHIFVDLSNPVSTYKRSGTTNP